MAVKKIRLRKISGDQYVLLDDIPLRNALNNDTTLDEHVQDSSLHTGSASDMLVAVQVGTTPDYLGASSSTGVLRTSSPLTYTDGGNYVTLGLDSSAISHNNLDDLQGGTSNEYYHLTSAEHSRLTGITSTQISNWDTAYSWGNHATAGYLKSADAATTYLKLDCSNDPLEDSLRINGYLGINTDADYPIHEIDDWGLVNASTDTDLTTKNFRFGAMHYNNAEEPMIIIHGNTATTINKLNIGGGTSRGNAATRVSIYTASNNTTLTGTEWIRLDESG